MFGNRDIPVYLFTGFLESGKSTCFQEILEDLVSDDRRGRKRSR